MTCTSEGRQLCGDCLVFAGNQFNCHVLLLSILPCVRSVHWTLLVLVPVESTSKTTIPGPRVNLLRFLSVSRISYFLCSSLVKHVRHQVPLPARSCSSSGLNPLGCETLVALSVSALGHASLLQQFFNQGCLKIYGFRFGYGRLSGQQGKEQMRSLVGMYTFAYYGQGASQFAI